MNRYEELTVRLMAARSYVAVLLIATFFALAGPFLTAWADWRGIWALWIPLCFFCIPAVHHLAKKTLALEDRISRLEERKEAR